MELYDKDEIREWEGRLLEATVKRVYKTKKNYKYPRGEKLNEYRRHRGTKWFYCGESKWARRNMNRKFRRKNKPDRLNEDSLKPVPHDYRTYGWITW